MPPRSKTLKSLLSNVTDIKESELKLIEEKLSKSSGVIIGWHSSDETSGYTEMDHDQIANFILALLIQYPDVLEQVTEEILADEEEPSTTNMTYIC